VTAPAGPAAEPAQPPDDQGETSIMREDSPRRSPRTPATPRDGAKPVGNPVDATANKLRSYGAAGGSARDTGRLADPAKAVETKVESYATSGSPVPATNPEGPKDATPGEPGPANAAAAANAAAPAGDAANPAPKRKRSDSKKDAAGTAGGAGDTAGGTAVHSPRRPHRAQAPVIQPPRGNN
jgi:hypothetical protein